LAEVRIWRTLPVDRRHAEQFDEAGKWEMRRKRIVPTPLEQSIIA
jgi:hypothetical protein